MADIFISYSRRDKAFVQQLFESMNKAERDVWVDWDDIPSASDWQKEINEGIEEAHTFIFVISPDSVNSPYCRQEVEYAAARKKRIIPILYREVPDEDDAKMHSSVSSHNWIMVRDGQETLDAKFPDLLKTIDTDLDYVKMHRRLYVKAQEWDNHHRETSYLLKGVELGEASKWLETADTKDPEPMPLHSIYIIASRNAQRKQARQLLMAALAAVVVSLVLAVFAINRAFVAENQRQIAVTAQSIAIAEADSRATQESIAVTAQNRAEEQAAIAQTQQAIAEAEEARAEREAALARSQALAFGARNAATQNQLTALALALEAVNIENPPSAAQRTLAELAYNPGPAFAYAPSNGEGILGISAEGRVLSQTSTGEIILWDGTQRQVLLTFSEAVTNWQDRAVFSPDGLLVATASMDDGVILWDTTTGEVVWKLNNGGTLWRSIVFDQTATRLLTMTPNKEVVVWDIESRSILRRISSDTRIVFDESTLSPDGQLLAISDVTGQIRVFPVDGDAPAQTLVVGSRALNLSFTPDGTHLAYISEFGELAIFDLSSGEISRTFPKIDNTVFTSMSFNTSGTTLVLGGASGNITIWEIESDALPQQFTGQGTAIDYVLFSLDERVIISRSFMGNSVLYWDRSNGEIIDQSEPVTMVLGDIRLNRDNTLIVMTDETTERASLLDANTWELLHTFGDEAHPAVRANFSADSQEILTAGLDGTVTVWNAADGSIIRSFMTVPYLDAIFSDDSVYLVTNHDDNIWTLWDMSTGTQVWSMPGGTTWSDIKFTPDKRQMLVTVDQDVVMLNVADGSEIWRQTFRDSVVIMFATFNQAGSEALIGTGAGVVVLLNTADGSVIRTYSEHTGFITAVAFSPDENSILSGDLNQTVIWWDKATGQSLHTYSGLPFIPVRLALNPETHTLFVGLADSAFMRLRADTLESLKQWTLDNRLVRPLDCDEQRQYDVLLSESCDQTGG